MSQAANLSRRVREYQNQFPKEKSCGRPAFGGTNTIKTLCGNSLFPIPASVDYFKQREVRLGQEVLPALLNLAAQAGLRPMEFFVLSLLIENFVAISWSKFAESSRPNYFVNMAA